MKFEARYSRRIRPETHILCHTMFKSCLIICRCKDIQARVLKRWERGHQHLLKPCRSFRKKE